MIGDYYIEKVNCRYIIENPIDKLFFISKEGDSKLICNTLPEGLKRNVSDGTLDLI